MVGPHNVRDAIPLGAPPCSPPPQQRIRGDSPQVGDGRASPMAPPLEWVLGARPSRWPGHTGRQTSELGPPARTASQSGSPPPPPLPSRPPHRPPAVHWGWGNALGGAPCAVPALSPHCPRAVRKVGCSSPLVATGPMVLNSVPPDAVLNGSCTVL